MNHNLKATSQH